MKKPPNYIIRPANPEDAQQLSEYLHNLENECLEEILPFSVSLDSKSQIESILFFTNTEDACLMLLFSDEMLIGTIDFIPNKTIGKKHCGKLGISIKKEFRGMGFGKILLAYFLEQSSKLKHIRRIELDVLSNNPVALKLYRQLGFVEEGKKISGVFNRNQYRDIHQMVFFNTAD
jgi:RimJ/RimL family protein N-acetyltransferase